MKLILDPSVHVLSRMTTDRGELARFLASIGRTGEKLDPAAPPAEVPVTLGSRTCYQSFDKGRDHAAHVRHLTESRHGSCHEHAVWGVMLAGISRSCGQQLIRHRHLSPSQLSQRYVTMDEAAVVVPPLYLAAHETWVRNRWTRVGSWFEDWLDQQRRAFERYLIDLKLFGGGSKVSREAARSSLPECAETRIYFTGNARAWRNFFERRCSPHADWEARRVADAVFDALLVEAPNVFGDYERTPLPDGTFAVSSPHTGA